MPATTYTTTSIRIYLYPKPISLFLDCQPHFITLYLKIY